MIYSPLRYPGGKGKITPLIQLLIKQQNNINTYIEPFAGGAGVAIELLENNIVERIVINDFDKRIASFWKAVLENPERFVYQIMNVPLTMDEWNRQRDICWNQANGYSFELGFATFYMNRTNRSGIIKGGVIGGKEQAGNWRLDARFNREKLARRVERIAERKKDICVYSQEIGTFLKRYISKYEENAFVYFDPPYFDKGKQLYMNYFQFDDHVRIKDAIKEKVKSSWVITYDDSADILKIYDGYSVRKFDLNYSAANVRRASELIIFKNRELIPSKEELAANGININLRAI